MSDTERIARDREWREDITQWMRRIEEKIDAVKTNQVQCSAYHKPITERNVRDVESLDKLVTGGQNPEKGLPHRIAALEKSAESQNKLYWMIVGTGITALASLTFSVGKQILQLIVGHATKP